MPWVYVGEALPHDLRVCSSCLITCIPSANMGCALHGDGVQNEKSPAIGSVSPSFSFPGKRGDGRK